MANLMRRLGIPITRENYIRVLHGRMPTRAEWTSEHEMDLPPELREE